jgi:hypothetical protein
VHAAGDLESAGETSDDVSISLPVKFDLAGFILYELGLVAAFDGTEFVSATSGKQDAGEGEGHQTNQEQDSQNDVKETDSSELFEHSWNLAVQSRQVFLRRRLSGSVPGSIARREAIIVEQLLLCQRDLASLNTSCLRIPADLSAESGL